MKKALALALAAACLLLTGCAGTTVIYQEVAPPDTSQSTPPENSGSGALQTGFALITDTTASQNGVASYDVTVAAVLLDGEGVIRACALDGAAAQMSFDETGALTGDHTLPVTTYQTENGVWARRAEALTRAAVGKTLRQLRAAGEWDTRLLTAVEQAVANARSLGAQEGDELRLAVQGDLAGSTAATGEESGRARLNCDAAVLTLSGEIITSCSIDSVQADVTFDTSGALTGEGSDRVPTKTELGDAYGMKAYGGAKYEWYEQAAHFSAYATGKTAQQILSLPLQDGKPVNADLAASVTISVTPFQSLVARACGPEQEVAE